MTFSIQISRYADRYFGRLEPRLQIRILSRLNEIAADPFGPHTKQLKNQQGRRSARVGDIRIIFSVNESDRVVEVSDIAPRGRAYRDI